MHLATCAGVPRTPILLADSARLKTVRPCANTIVGFCPCTFLAAERLGQQNHLLHPGHVLHGAQRLVHVLHGVRRLVQGTCA